MAQDSVKELNLLMEGKKAKGKKVYLPTELVVRESAQHIS
jgi:DNA-binding LacI/PurR family transcriptional regulator